MLLLLSLIACSDITLRPLPSDALTGAGDTSTDGAPLDLDAAGIPAIEAPAPDWIDIPCVVPGLTLYGEGTTSEGAWSEGALDVRLDYAEGDLDQCPGMHFASEPATLEFTLLDDGTWVLDLTTLDADAKATLDKIADALADGRWVDPPTQDDRPHRALMFEPASAPRLSVDVAQTMHRVYDRAPVIVVDRAPARQWGDDLSASLHRLWEEDRRRAQAEFAAIVAEPPKPNRAQRRAARKGRR